MSLTFSSLGVSAELIASLARRDITTPSPIQAASLEASIAGRDVCGRAPTGSGKTLAFAIPVAQRVPRARVARPRALVLAPTRELAAQITTELQPLLALNKRSVAAFYGGTSFTPQLKALRRGVDVAVGCPGRLGDLVRRTNMSLDDVELVVIDEADRMADMGFLPEVKRLLDATRPDRQTLLFSATLDGDVDVLIKRYQREPVRCDVAPRDDHVDRTEHITLDVARDRRIAATAALVAEHGSAVVFCRTKHGADRVARQLKASGVSAVAIHGDRSQSQRERALAAFTAGQAQALVATDVAARGIHVDDVGVVVHFDPASDDKAYIHRSGRTGRAGATGTVVTFREQPPKGAPVVKAVGGGGNRSAPKSRAGRPGSPARQSRQRRRRAA